MHCVQRWAGRVCVCGLHSISAGGARRVGQASQWHGRMGGMVGRGSVLRGGGKGASRRVAGRLSTRRKACGARTWYQIAPDSSIGPSAFESPAVPTGRLSIPNGRCPDGRSLKGAPGAPWLTGPSPAQSSEADWPSRFLTAPPSGWRDVPPSAAPAPAGTHGAMASRGIHCSSRVPPQLFEMRPSGTGPPSARVWPAVVSASDTVRPKTQHTAEKVAKSVCPGVTSSLTVLEEATCQGSRTVFRSRSGIADCVPMPTVKMRMCG
eukprot:scaffold23788_cov126-Isochrysis_galbana.AAC.7